jgi:hypothetical protein
MMRLSLLLISCILVILLVICGTTSATSGNNNNNNNNGGGGLSASEAAELAELDALIALQQRRLELLKRGRERTDDDISTTTAPTSECRDGICESSVYSTYDKAPPSPSPSSSPSSPGPSSRQFNEPSQYDNEHMLLVQRPSLALSARSPSIATTTGVSDGDASSQHVSTTPSLGSVTAVTGISLRLPTRRGAPGSDTTRSVNARRRMASNGATLVVAISVAIVAQPIIGSSSSSLIRFFDVDQARTGAASIHDITISCASITRLAATPGTSDNFIMAACHDGSLHGLHIVGWLDEHGTFTIVPHH